MTGKLGIEATYSIINKMCTSARVKGAVQQLGTKKERHFAKSRILHEFARSWDRSDQFASYLIIAEAFRTARCSFAS